MTERLSGEAERDRYWMEPRNQENKDSEDMVGNLNKKPNGPEDIIINTFHSHRFFYLTLAILAFNKWFVT